MNKEREVIGSLSLNQIYKAFDENKDYYNTPKYIDDWIQNCTGLVNVLEDNFITNYNSKYLLDIWERAYYSSEYKTYDDEYSMDKQNYSYQTAAKATFLSRSGTCYIVLCFRPKIIYKEG